MIGNETIFRPGTGIERREVAMHPTVFPVLIGAVVGFGAHRWHLLPAYQGADALAFAGAVASIGATMLGFILAALAVIASISNTHLVQMMHRTGHYKSLLATMVGCGLLFLLCALCGLAVLFGVPASPVVLALTVGIHVAAWIALLDTARKFALVLSNLRPG